MKIVDREIVSALIISKDNKILMGKKDSSGGGVYADCWHIPGGGVNKGEDKLAALYRETYEEVGMDISENDVILVDSLGSGESIKKDILTDEQYVCKMKFKTYTRLT